MQKNANFPLIKKSPQEFDKMSRSGYNWCVHLYSYATIMFDTKKAKKDFIALDHQTKLNKVKETLELLSRKSSFFADLRNHFKGQKDIQENALDAMYGVVMNLVYNGQK